MITSNVLNRVFFIKGDQYGTAFTIDVESRQYLISAKHLFSDAENTKSIKLFFDKRWIELPVIFVGQYKGEIDIVVFSSWSITLSPSWPMPPTSDKTILGQDVFFLGYPFKMWVDMGETLANRPVPFIKKGTLSAWDNSNGVKKLYIDAINNEGFSGGPLIFLPYGSQEFCVAGIVSSFKIENENVVNGNGDKTKLTVAYNTGFLLAYDIQYAVNIINSNPIGLRLENAD